MIHKLKLQEPWYTRVEDKEKRVEIRKFDRDFQVGDILYLYLYNPDPEEEIENPPYLVRRITHVLYHHQCNGLLYGYCAISMEVV